MRLVSSSATVIGPPSQTRDPVLDFGVRCKKVQSECGTMGCCVVAGEVKGKHVAVYLALGKAPRFLISSLL